MTLNNSDWYRELLELAFEEVLRQGAEGLEHRSARRPQISDSPWDVLGLTPGASRAEINAAFREKAKRWHPDAGGSHEQMAKLNAARTELLRRAG